MFPQIRMRRNRRTEGLRKLSEQTQIMRNDLILPLFVVPGAKRTEDISAMPGVCRMSADRLVQAAKKLRAPAVMLFGVPDPTDKDAEAGGATAPDGLVASTVKELKKACPDLIVITDVCLCAYTHHGHCGVIDKNGRIDNDATIKRLGQMAAVHAAAGADMVGPSAMMDGQVKAIREELDNQGFSDTAIMSYAAKFASSFYGPFREAAKSAPSFGDRRSYQLPSGNRHEAIRDGLLDEAEGADWLMVKPAMPYLDILRELSDESRLPVAAYQTSGEYAMLKHAALAEAFEESAAVVEAIICVKRAGASAIITYYSEQICSWLSL